jgi:diacylglycerol kinase family enzyme
VPIRFVLGRGKGFRMELKIKGIGKRQDDMRYLVCKSEDGKPLNLTEGEKTYLRAADPDDGDLLVKVVTILDDGRVAILETTKTAFEVGFLTTQN